MSIKVSLALSYTDLEIKTVNFDHVMLLILDSVLHYLSGSHRDPVLISQRPSRKCGWGLRSAGGRTAGPSTRGGQSPGSSDGRRRPRVQPLLPYGWGAGGSPQASLTCP